MNPGNLRDNERLREMLVSEYVLGTLRGGARRRLEAWMREDMALRRSVSEWQDRLQPMAGLVTPVAPPAHVWQKLQQQLDLHARDGRSRDARPNFWQSLRTDLSFWRGLGMASTALATILITVLLSRQPDMAAPAPSYIATLADDQAQLAVLVTGDARRRQLTVKVVTSRPVGPDRTLQLWAIPATGAPRSLGLVAGSGTVTLPLPAGADPANIPVLAISLEPKGGSPNPAGPTGPVLYKGAWLQI